MINDNTEVFQAFTKWAKDVAAFFLDTPQRMNEHDDNFIELYYTTLPA